MMTTTDSRIYDIVVIGGGVVGLAVCRAVALQGYSVCCVEKESHLLVWASGSNSGILCTGTDAAIGTLERALIRDSMAQLRPFCRDMNIPIRPCGSLVCQWPWDHDNRNESNHTECNGLQTVLMQSHDAGDTNATLLSPKEVLEKEPYLNPVCLGAVHIPGEIVVDPWLHAIAYAVHARQNGAIIYTNFEVDSKQSSFCNDTKLWSLRRKPKDYIMHRRDDTTPEQLQGHIVVNATGLWADVIQRDMLDGRPPEWMARPRRGQYRVFQASSEQMITHPIQPIPTEQTKGIFVFSTLYNHIVVGPTAKDQESRSDRSVDPNTIEELAETVKRIMPDSSSWKVIGDYVGIRPGSNHRDYQIHLRADKHWLVCAGIRSTGLTASLGIGRHVLQLLQTSGLLQSPHNFPIAGICTKPLPALNVLAMSFRESGDEESVEIDEHSYKVTHPLTRFGFAGMTGLAAADS